MPEGSQLATWRFPSGLIVGMSKLSTLYYAGITSKVGIAKDTAASTPIPSPSKVSWTTVEAAG